MAIPKQSTTIQDLERAYEKQLSEFHFPQEGYKPVVSFSRAGAENVALHLREIGHRKPVRFVFALNPLPERLNQFCRHRARPGEKYSDRWCYLRRRLRPVQHRPMPMWPPC